MDEPKNVSKVEQVQVRNRVEDRCPWEELGQKWMQETRFLRLIRTKAATKSASKCSKINFLITWLSKTQKAKTTGCSF